MYVYFVNLQFTGTCNQKKTSIKAVWSSYVQMFQFQLWWKIANLFQWTVDEKISLSICMAQFFSPRTYPTQNIQHRRTRAKVIPASAWLVGWQWSCGVGAVGRLLLAPRRARAACMGWRACECARARACVYGLPAGEARDAGLIYGGRVPHWVNAPRRDHTQLAYNTNDWTNPYITGCINHKKNKEWMARHWHKKLKMHQLPGILCGWNTS